MPLHDSLHCSLSWEKTCCTAHSVTFGLWGLSGQIGEVHLDLEMFVLCRKQINKGNGQQHIGSRVSNFAYTFTKPLAIRGPYYYY